MKFRPQIQLRFRSEAQFRAMKDLAANEAPSMNEWILQQVEKLNPSIAEESVTAPTTKVRAKADKSRGCADCGALNGMHQRGCAKGKK